MKVTKIVKKDAENVALHCDNNEVLFLSVVVFMKSGLRKNEEISEDRFLLLVRENRIFHIKQKAFRYLGRRLHSRAELKTKLLQKKYDYDLINVVLDDLEEKKYLNDSEFAKTFTEEKIKSKLWGEKKLKAELIKRGIKSGIVTGVLSEMISNEDNYKNALSVAEKKYKALQSRKLDEESVKKKLVNFLNSRGFDYEIIKDVYEAVLKIKKNTN